MAYITNGDNMKKLKYIVVALAVFLLMGCTMSNTPTSKVEDLFSKYQTLDNDIKSDINEVLKEQNYLEKTIILGIRPEDISDKESVIAELPQWAVQLKVDISELLGAESQITVKLPGTDRVGQSVTAKVPARADVHMGDEIKLAFNMEKCHFFDPETTNRIRRP